MISDVGTVVWDHRTKVSLILSPVSVMHNQSESPMKESHFEMERNENPVDPIACGGTTEYEWECMNSVSLPR